MTKILFIDFDETLFHHRAYLSWADSFMAERHITASPGQYENLTDQFHESKGENMDLYDHLGHIKSVTTRSWGYISGELEKEMHEKQHDFCYDDAHEFLTKASASGWDVRLLTYGHGDYQRYKIRTCQVLSQLRIPVHLVTEPKSDFLKREFKSRHGGLLVDDKYPLRLPNGWTHVWLDRSNARKENSKDNTGKVQKVSSLSEITLS